MRRPYATTRVLPEAFFDRDAVSVARDLLGKVVVSTAGGELTAGRIVETEAYLGVDDPGSHAATKGITRRNSVMYGPPGRAYVYFTYGNHHMLNLVTEAAGTAGAVLIRALEPIDGLETMRVRRAARRASSRPLSDIDLTNGPGKLASALGIDLAQNGSLLDGSATVSVHDAPRPGERIVTSGRIGLTQGHEAELRFFLENDPYVSTGRTGSKATRARRERGQNT